MNDTNGLIDAVIKRMGEISNNTVSPVPPGEDEPESNIELKKPTIFDGYIPYERDGDESVFPYIIVRMESGGVREDDDNVKVKMLVGGFDEKANGYRWGVTLIDRIRSSFAAYPLLESMFTYGNDFQWKLYDDQPYPHWYIEAVASWSIQKPQEVQSIEDV